jgi:hypothetical protein
VKSGFAGDDCQLVLAVVSSSGQNVTAACRVWISVD